MAMIVNDTPAEPRKARMVKGPRRISFTVTEQQFHDLHDLAYRSRGSVSQLGQMAILQLLIDVETGRIPILSEFRRGLEPGHA